MFSLEEKLGGSNRGKSLSRVMHVGCHSLTVGGWISFLPLSHHISQTGLLKRAQVYYLTAL